MTNLFHLNLDFAWFIGRFDHNQRHRHYAVQLSIPLHGSITVLSPGGNLETEQPLIIRSNVAHQLSCRDTHFLLLFNPASSIGHFWQKAITADVAECIIPAARELQQILMQEDLSAKVLAAKINAQIKAYDCFCRSVLHQGDERIEKALAYLQAHAERSVPLAEIADYCHLSGSRFLHLFKQETNISYRRAQQWNRLIQAVKLMGSLPLTSIAHEAGFSDSAHFSRSFKENFGFSPRDFIKFSQFIQV